MGSEDHKRQGDDDDVVIARIIKARGIKGEVACNVGTDFPDRFETLEDVTVWMPNGSRLHLTLEDSWFHQNRVILKFRDYDTMTAAEGLVGGRVVIEDGDLESPEEGEFLERRVVGMDVVTIDGESVGKVTRVMRTGGTDLLVLEGPDRREHLIPFADEICTKVDLEAKRITLNPPSGLLDL